MQFAAVAATRRALEETPSRKAKVAALAELLRAGDPDEVAIVSDWLAGELPQGKLGVGYRALAGLSGESAESPSLTVRFVDERFGVIKGLSGKGSAAAREAELGRLFHSATVDEQALLRSLVTGELRQGAMAAVMADAVAAAYGLVPQDVRRAAMFAGGLAPVARAAAAEGSVAGFGLTVGSPVQPMLASPSGSSAIAFGTGEPVRVEDKLDGARVQVHRSGQEVTVFTRTPSDITERVPELVALARLAAADSFILDGEALLLDEHGRARPFQQTMARLSKQTGAQPDPVQPFFFDILHLDGRDLIDEPLTERDAALGQVVPEHLAHGTTASSEAQVVAWFEDALARGNEGVVVKDLDAPYAAGRRGSAWRKLKPVHTLDLVVIGVERGSGRRRGTLSNLHLGARDPQGGPPIMVGKTYRGLTDELLAWQTAEFPAFVVGGNEWQLELRPHFVVEIGFDGVQRSPRYPGGVALRFARVLRYRPDKTPAQADSIDDVLRWAP